MKKRIAYTDGASRGNPGIAGIGVLITDDEGNTIKEISEHIGDTTNNIAEYTALITALREVFEMCAEVVEVYSDSELMVRQINGVYRVKNEGLKPLYGEAKSLIGKFKSFKIEHIKREFNKVADELANKGIDAELERRKPL